MPKNTAPRVSSLHPCECSLWEFDLDVERDDDYSTGCTAMTHRTFAQGHDAKLVGFMVRADIAGHDISKREGGVLVTFGGAIQAAASISDALALKAEVQMVAQNNRRTAKAERKSVSKTPKQAMNDLVERQAEAILAMQPEPMFRDAKIKIGRWTYDAKIATETGSATYRTKLGQDKMALAGEYKEV